MSSYQESLEYLYSLQKFGIKLGLDNITSLLKSLGNPEKGLKFIHMGGTNGKGSTAAILTSILTTAGFRVGLFTSPHLHDFRERIRIGNQPISPDRVVELTARIKKALDEGGRVIPATFFEFNTAMALLYFFEAGVDLAVLEVGMGGRLDATNVVDPLISIITNISFDHTQYLGKSLKEIAWEKLGIVKRGRPLIAGVDQPELVLLFNERCRDMDSPLYLLGRDIDISETGGGRFEYKGIYIQHPDLMVSLPGRHQMINAALALASVELLGREGFPVAPKHIRAGLMNVRWPGRLEHLPTTPLVILDGAHNPGGISALREALRGYSYKNLILVFGVMEDKDWPTMIADLAPLVKRVILTRPNLSRSCPPQLLREEARKNGLKGEVIESVAEAVAAALRRAGPEDIVLVTGSLFTVAEAREALGVAPRPGQI